MDEALVAFLRARLDEDERELVKDPPMGLGYANLPARIHREVEAKRAILDEYDRADGGYGYLRGLEFAIVRWGAVYRDRPDYRREWGP